MYEYTRSALKDGNLGHNGPYEAMVISHLDRYYQGTLLVELIRHYGSSNVGRRSGQLMAVKYVSPFYGVTPYDGLNENDGYQNTQKSYGFWAVPPDFGTRVLVIFAESSGPYGYWIGCIQDPGMNFMTPGGVATGTILTTDDTPEELQGKKLPVGEYNKLIETGEAADPTLFKKPYNKDFTGVMQVQGLLNDEIRGTTTSSARREIPSMVFGISTPGPLDKRKGHSKAKYGAAEEEAEIPFNRLGGSSFVMDDGDDKFVRATHAEDGPPIYLNRELGEQGGDETIPQNELVRLRTRTGHQILMHNSEDLIYIANSRGTAWLEFTSDGKIDIYAYDSISLHTDNDFNLSAGRDINMEASRNVNINASAQWSDYNEVEQEKVSGTVRIEGATNTDIYSGKAFRFQTEENFEIFSNNDIMFTSRKNIHLNSQGHIFESSKGAIHQNAEHSIYRTSKSNINDYSDGLTIQTAKGPIHRKSLEDTIHDTAGIDYNLIAKQDVLITSYNNYNLLVDVNANTTAENINDNARTDYFRTAVNINDKSTLHYTNNLEVTGTVVISSKLTAGDDISTTSNFNGSIVNATPAGPKPADVPSITEPTPASEAAEANPAFIASKATTSNAASNVPRTLNSHLVPYVQPGSGEIFPLKTAIPRVPQHEPWPHHENLNPLAFKKHLTDVENIGSLPTADRILTPDTFTNGVAGVSTSVRIAASGGNISNDTEGTYGNVDPNENANSDDIGPVYPTVGAGPVPAEVDNIPPIPSSHTSPIVNGVLPENVVSLDPDIPRQNVIDSISLAAKLVAPKLKILITPKGGVHARPSGTIHHPWGHAADFRLALLDENGELIPDGGGGYKVLTAPNNPKLYRRLIEELISNANSRGVRPGIGWYPNSKGGFIHYDESPSRQGKPGKVGYWENTAPIKQAITNVENNRRTAVDANTRAIAGTPSDTKQSANINSGNTTTTNIPPNDT